MGPFTNKKKNNGTFSLFNQNNGTFSIKIKKMGPLADVPNIKRISIAPGPKVKLRSRGRGEDNNNRKIRMVRKFVEEVKKIKNEEEECYEQVMNNPSCFICPKYEGRKWNTQTRSCSSRRTWRGEKKEKKIEVEEREDKCGGGEREIKA